VYVFWHVTDQLCQLSKLENFPLRGHNIYSPRLFLSVQIWIKQFGQNPISNDENVRVPVTLHHRPPMLLRTCMTRYTRREIRARARDGPGTRSRCRTSSLSGLRYGAARCYPGLALLDETLHAQQRLPRHRRLWSRSWHRAAISCSRPKNNLL
jgi:hypothetical protein